MTRANIIKKVGVITSILTVLCTVTACGSEPNNNDNFGSLYTRTSITETCTTSDSITTESMTETTEEVQTTQVYTETQTEAVETSATDTEGSISMYIAEERPEVFIETAEYTTIVCETGTSTETVYDDSTLDTTTVTEQTSSAENTSTPGTTCSENTEETVKATSMTSTAEYTAEVSNTTETTSEVSTTETVTETKETTKATTVSKEEQSKATSNSETEAKYIIKNPVSPSKYNIKASDGNIMIDETAMTGEFGLLKLYEKYNKFHIAWKIESLQTGKSLEYNNTSDMYFSSCCTIKAALALYVCNQLESPECEDTLNTKVYYDSTNPRHAHGGSGDIQKYGSRYYTIRELLTYCITISDNDAYCVLLDHFGYENFNKFLKSMGSSSSVSPSNVMGYASIENRTIEWKEIVKFCFGRDKKTEESKLLWDILTKANSSPIRNAIANYTNLNAVVSHKSGWYNGKSGTSNDCAVITLRDGRKYLMLIFTEQYKGKYDNALVEGIATNLTRFFESVN